MNIRRFVPITLLIGFILIGVSATNRSESDVAVEASSGQTDPPVIHGEEKSGGTDTISRLSKWTNCEGSQLGANLISWATSDFDDTTGPELVDLSQAGFFGFVASTTYRDASIYFPDLDGWEKALLCNSHACLEGRAANAQENNLHYDFLGYGPERLGGVPEGEKSNLPWATEVARQIAEQAGKKLLISYSTKQLHMEALERDFGWDRPDSVIKLLAPFGDRWMIQAADEYNNPNDPEFGSYGPILSQRHFSPGPEWRGEVEKWTRWIREANPEIEIWIQIALHRIGLEGENTPSAELALEYREWLVNPEYGPPLVDGVYISSTYSWPLDSVVADSEMERTFMEACGSTNLQFTPTPLPPPVFADVPTDHPYHNEIEALFLSGYTAGCNTDPLMYCPDDAMTRAESAVFVERGVHGSEYIPPEPAEQVFSDVSLTEWYAKWATGLWRDGYTSGCKLSPLLFCPSEYHTRSEGTVFTLRIMHGRDYVPPPPVGLFADVPIEYWGAKWIEAAYSQDLIPACNIEPLEFCPYEPLSRGLGAYMISRSLGLLPQSTPVPDFTPTATHNPTIVPSETSTPTPDNPGIIMNLIEEGSTEGYHYWLYENPRYPCGAGDGNHEFLVLQRGVDLGNRNLLMKFPGGGVGFYYENLEGVRTYYPHENALGLILARYNRNMLFRVALKEGLTRIIRERDDFRLLVPSYCSHDLYYGKGQYDQTDDFQRWGFIAVMEAVDFVEQIFPTNQIITYGGSAGASGAFLVGANKENVTGIIMDSQAVDLSGIRDACIDEQLLFGPAHPCYCPESSNTTCMEVLAPRIGFTLGQDEPYVLVNQGLINVPIFYIWNQNDGSRFAFRQFQNLHDALENQNPGENSIAKMVCIDDPNITGREGRCNLHVPTAYEYEDSIPLNNEIYAWVISILQ
jgi:hypothetical protein